MTAEPPAPATPNDTPETVRLTFRARRVLWIVFGVAFTCEVGMLVLDYHINYGRLINLSPIRQIFNAQIETALASWFAVTQTFLVALTLWGVLITVRAIGAPRMVRLGWLLLAMLFTYMTIDDGAKIHERVGSSVRMMQERAAIEAGTAVDSTLTGMFPSYSWQVVFLPFFAAAGMGMLAFLWWQMRSWSARAMVVGAIACLVIAVGLDFSEGLEEIHPLNFVAGIGDMPAVDRWALERFDREGVDAVRHFGRCLEETLEMLGITLLWVAILRHWMHRAAHVELRFVSKRSTA